MLRDTIYNLFKQAAYEEDINKYYDSVCEQLSNYIVQVMEMPHCFEELYKEFMYPELFEKKGEIIHVEQVRH